METRCQSYEADIVMNDASSGAEDKPGMKLGTRKRAASARTLCKRHDKRGVVYDTATTAEAGVPEIDQPSNAAETGGIGRGAVEGE